MRFLILFLFATVALAQAPLKKPNRALDQDQSICVDDGGVERCLTVDGPTGAVKVGFPTTGILDTAGIVNNTIPTLEIINGEKNNSTGGCLKFRGRGSGVDESTPPFSYSAVCGEQDGVGIQGLSFWSSIADDDPQRHMYLQSTGNLGLGTTGPTEKLDVVGNIKSSATITGVTVDASSIVTTNSLAFDNGPVIKAGSVSLLGDNQAATVVVDCGTYAEIICRGTSSGAAGIEESCRLTARAGDYVSVYYQTGSGCSAGLTDPNVDGDLNFYYNSDNLVVQNKRGGARNIRCLCISF